MGDSLFFENGSGACVRVVDREKWSVRALRRIEPRTKSTDLDVLGYIAADETPLPATDVPPSFAWTRQSYPRQTPRVLRTVRDVRPTQQWTVFVRQSRSRSDRERENKSGFSEALRWPALGRRRGTRRPRESSVRLLGVRLG